MSHSFLPPSGASSWEKCSLWPTMNKLYPQEDSPESVEGTAAHWVSLTMQGEHVLSPGDVTPNGSIVTDEMLDAGEIVIETLQPLFDKNLIVHVEESVKILHVHQDCFGTPDYWAFDIPRMHLHLFDYKYGHRFVDEYFNPQGMLYALGILAELDGKIAGDVSNITISFTVIQPRCYYKGETVRTHTYRATELIPHLSRLQAAALAAYEPSPVATTNPQCVNCPGRHACSALQQAAYSDAEFSNNRQPVELSPNAAALELRMLERAQQRIDARVDGLKELTTQNLIKGEKIAFYHLENGKPRSQWKETPEAMISIGQLFGKDLSKPGIVTPNQAKKMGLEESVVSHYSFTPTGSTKLVADNPNDVRKVFNK